MNYEQFRCGDVLSVWVGVFRHKCLFLGMAGGAPNAIVQNTQKHGRVTLNALEEFAEGRPITVERRGPTDWYQQQIIAQRALAMVGRPYAFWTFNCEDFVTDVLDDKPVSPQRDGLSIAGLGALALIFILSPPKK